MKSITAIFFFSTVQNLCNLLKMLKIAITIASAITIFLGSGWPMFSEITLMLYQQDLQLGPYFVKCKLAIDRGFPIDYFAK